MLSHCHRERKSERDSMRFLWLQSARWLGFPGGTDKVNFDIPCGSGGRLKCLPQGASDVVTPLTTNAQFCCCRCSNVQLERWHMCDKTTSVLSCSTCEHPRQKTTFLQLCSAAFRSVISSKRSRRRTCMSSCFISLCCILSHMCKRH